MNTNRGTRAYRGAVHPESHTGCFLGPQSSGFPSGESGKRGQLSAPKRVHFTVYRLKESLPDRSRVKWDSFENLDFPGPETSPVHTSWPASVVSVCLKCSVSFDSIVFFFSLPQCQLACVLVAQSCLTLCDPMGCIACQTPLSMGILQATILEWVAMPSSGESSRPRDWTQVSLIAGRFFTVWATWEAQAAQADSCVGIAGFKSLSYRNASYSVPNRFLSVPCGPPHLGFIPGAGVDLPPSVHLTLSLLCSLETNGSEEITVCWDLAVYHFTLTAPQWGGCMFMCPSPLGPK